MYCELMSRSILEGGQYLAADVARLAGVPGDRIGQWARWGHIRASVSGGDPHVYAWGDVAEALAVHLLLRAGVTLPTIRRAVDVIAGPWPLCGGGVHVVDGRIAIERRDGLEDAFSAQRVLAGPGDARPGPRAGGAEVAPVAVWTTIDAQIRLARGGWTSSDAVEVDPARVGGRPCVRGTRLAVADLAADPDQDLGLHPAVRAAALAWWEASWPA